MYVKELRERERGIMEQQETSADTIGGGFKLRCFSFAPENEKTPPNNKNTNITYKQQQTTLKAYGSPCLVVCRSYITTGEDVTAAPPLSDANVYPSLETLRSTCYVNVVLLRSKLHGRRNTQNSK